MQAGHSRNAGMMCPGLNFFQLAQKDLCQRIQQQPLVLGLLVGGMSSLACLTMLVMGAVGIRLARALD